MPCVRARPSAKSATCFGPCGACTTPGDHGGGGGLRILNPLRPMSEGHRTRNIVARVIVALLFGIAMGYAIGQSLAGDAARGRTLTMKEYVANFENYKNHLIGDATPRSEERRVGKECRSRWSPYH